jgi:hypothetical protein
MATLALSPLVDTSIPTRTIQWLPVYTHTLAGDISSEPIYEKNGIFVLSDTDTPTDLVLDGILNTVPVNTESTKKVIIKCLPHGNSFEVTIVSMNDKVHTSHITLVSVQSKIQEMSERVRTTIEPSK